MSRNVAVAIVGSGKTARNNVESLIGDFKDAVDSLTIIVSNTEITEGMTWAKQYAESQNLSVIEDQTVYDAIAELKLLEDKSVELKFFLLWDDDDPACQTAVAFAQQHSIPVFDLTDGLVRIPTDEIKVEAPTVSTMPESETTTSDNSPAPEPSSFYTPKNEDIFEDAKEPEIEWDDEDELYLEGGALIEAALEEAGKIMAKSFVEEMLRLLKEDRNGKA